MTKKIALTAASLLLAGVSFAAVSVNFSSPLFEIAKTSTGTSLTSSFTFSVGTFNDFVPDSNNVSSWTTNWISFGTTQWNEDEFKFDGTGELASNASAPAGKDVYIWGYNTQSVGAGTEWILFDNDIASDDTWATPAVGEVPSFTFIGINQTGTTAVLGSLFASGNDPYFQTAAVVPEPAHYAGILGAVALLVGFIRRRK